MIKVFLTKKIEKEEKEWKYVYTSSNGLFELDVINTAKRRIFKALKMHENIM